MLVQRMLPERLRQLREKAGLTQKQLASSIGVDGRYITSWERGETNASLGMCGRILRFFDVTEEYLIGKTDIPNIYEDPRFQELKALGINEEHMYLAIKLRETNISSKYFCKLQEWEYSKIYERGGVEMIGERLRELRQEAGFTEKQLGRKIGIDTSTIKKWESGQSKPSLNTCINIIKYFDITMSYLLGQTDIPNIYKELQIYKLKALGISKKHIPLAIELKEANLSIEDFHKIQHWIYNDDPIENKIGE